MTYSIDFKEFRKNIIKILIENKNELSGSFLRSEPMDGDSMVAMGLHQGGK
jgi:hypothetical protein